MINIDYCLNICYLLKDLAQDCLHIDKLRTFAEIVYGLDPAILSYSAETCCYTSIVASEHKDDEEEAVRKIANVKDLASSEELKHVSHLLLMHFVMIKFECSSCHENS